MRWSEIQLRESSELVQRRAATCSFLPQNPNFLSLVWWLLIETFNADPGMRYVVCGFRALIYCGLLYGLEANGGNNLGVLRALFGLILVMSYEIRD
ncbi:hypothetical protein AKJ16_DCAP07857 [Drosera capensis]